MAPAAALRLATRGSPQARTQAEHVAAAITVATGRPTELVLVDTTGDRVADVPLHVIGGQGVFVKEVQQAVLDGRADGAVHSAKDLPGEATAALRLAAFCTRRDPADALIGARLADLADGATVATGSVRRRAQLAATRPDLAFTELRGNIARRLAQIPEGGAIVMAVAALEVLELTELVTERLDPKVYVPAVGQGCVAVECRADDAETATLLAAVDDQAARHAVTAERAFLAELGAGCTLPLGAHADGGRMHAFLAASDQLDAGPVSHFRTSIALADDDEAAVLQAADLGRHARDAVGWAGP